MKKNQIFALLLFIIAVFNGIEAQRSKTKKKQSPANTEQNETIKSIQWMTMSQALEANNKSKRKILIDFYTDWCGWCRRMDNTTYSDPKVIKYINQTYYPVKFNAEKEAPVIFAGKEYKIKNSGNRGTHELAVMLLDGKMGYPSTTFLNSDLTRIQSVSGYIEADVMHQVLNYFGQDKHLSIPFEEFQKTFK